MKHCMYCFLLFIAAGSIHAQTIITIAGNGITQYIGDGSPATNYSLALPKSIFEDGKGNLLIADYYNHRIRKLAHDTLITIAGTGAAGYAGDGGPAVAALMENPDGIFLDTAGNMYITEYHNDVVRKVNALTGKITTVCGSGTGGYSGDGNMATTAHMETPAAACVDRSGNIYIPDYGNQRIRKVDFSSGLITTIAGTGVSGDTGDGGPATDAQLSYPGSVCLDHAGNIYISEYGNNRIRKIDAVTGIITTVAGNGIQGYAGDNGPAINAQLNQPNSVFVDKNGYIYISDFSNNVIRAVNPSGIIKTIAGTGASGYSGDGGPALNATFRGPTAVFADDSGYVFIADGDNSVIRKMMPVGNAVEHIILSSSLHIFPNPSHGKFTISRDDQSAYYNALIEIYNAVGNCIYSSTIETDRVNIDLTGHPAGIYFLKYSSPAGKSFQKIVLQ